MFSVVVRVSGKDEPGIFFGPYYLKDAAIKLAKAESRKYSCFAEVNISLTHDDEPRIIRVYRRGQQYPLKNY